MIEPQGSTLTFLFTDIEGSTQLWESDHEAMRSDLARHDELLSRAIAVHGGTVFKTMGDAFHAVFPTAVRGIHAAIDAQRALSSESWSGTEPLRVRMALHSGSAEQRDDDYFGPSLNRVSRLLDAGHGGQILLSEATHLLLRDVLPSDIGLRDLGRHRLKNLSEPERIYQVVAPGLNANLPPLRTLDARPNNLPHQSTSFIGRDDDIETVYRLLLETRLLTLLGPGGIGKTRIAIQVAAKLLDEFPDGVWMVDLASLADPQLVSQTVASVMKIKEQPGEPILSTLLDQLAANRVLIVLDNCEHLIDACARFAETVLGATSRLRILATSREPLGIAGEVRWQVPPLPVPEIRDRIVPEDLVNSDSVKLFVDRAQSLDPRFELTVENSAAVTEIVTSLDGLPLAIELAASRVTILSPQQIAERLDDRFRLLRTGTRTAVPRQQTLRALIDWSYELLSDEEKVLFARVTVFSGGFTLIAAETVASGDGIDPLDVLDLTGQLVEKSLVSVDRRTTGHRYRLLESLRVYGLERLRVSGEENNVLRKHSGYFLALAEQAAIRLPSDDYRRWLEQCEVELDNLRAAIAWSRINDIETALKIASSLRQFWWLKGYVHEGRATLESLMAHADDTIDTTLRLQSLRALGALAFRDGDMDLARSVFGQVRAIAAESGDPNLLARVLREHGGMLVEQMAYDEASRVLQESFDIQEERGDVEGAAWVRIDLGMLHMGRGEFPEASRHFDLSLQMAQQADDQWRVAVIQYFRGLISLAGGNVELAHSLLDQSLKICLANDYRWLVPGIIEGFAARWSLSGEFERSVTLAGAAKSLSETMSAAQAPFWRSVIDPWIDQARNHLTAERYDDAWSEGASMSPESAIACALTTSHAHTIDATDPGISAQQ